MKQDKTYELYLENLSNVFRSFPWEDKIAYTHWLAQTYYFVLKSTRLLALAGAHASEKQNLLHYRYLAHAGEEKAHEKLLINDLQEFSLVPQSIEEFPQTAGFYQAQYYWIQHVNPASFMGYIYPLEGLAVICGQEAYERVVKAHGKKAGSFLMVHSNEDIDHLEKAKKVIQGFNEKDFSDFYDNLKMSAGLYEMMLISCQNAANKNRAA